MMQPLVTSNQHGTGLGALASYKAVPKVGLAGLIYLCQRLPKYSLCAGNTHSDVYIQRTNQLRTD